MSDSIQTQGKTVDEAIAEACLQLGLRRDEVEVRVTQEPKSGLLGFLGGRPAKVVVRKKAERHRGRGRDNRSDDGGAHSLGRGRGGRGRSRGGRGRGGRGGNENQQSDPVRSESSAPQEARRDGGRNNERSSEGGGGGRGRGRGGRGRGGRDNSRYDGRSDGRSDGRNDNGNDGRNDSRNNNQSNNGNDNRNNARQESRNEVASAPASAPASGNRDESRHDERGGSNDQRRSRRGSRGGRGRSRRNNPENTPPINDANVVQPTEQAPQAAVVERAPERPVETPVVQPAAVEATPVAPASVDKPVVAPVVKKKRGGWGGGLGARLKTKANPSVPEKPAAEVEPAAYEPKLTAPAPMPTPMPTTERAPRYEERSRRPSDEIDEVIISGVKATKYANAVTGVTEETLDATLSDMTSGMLARAGFSCEVSVTDGEYRQVRITSEEESAGLLIGRHGQTVDAVEHLVERMASNSIDDRVRMNLDINEYRQRRQEDLFARVADAVEEVRESGKAYHMESMSARERRLVHLEAENVEGIRTFTMSGNGGKHVVLAADDEEKEDDRHDG